MNEVRAYCAGNLAHGGKTVVARDDGTAVAHGEPILRADCVSKRFGATQALAEVTLEVRRGGVHCLLGENGAGKSTLCNVIYGVHRADSGSLFLDGREHQPERPTDAMARGVAMVHQHFSLIPTLSALDNLLLGRSHGWLRRKPVEERLRRFAAQFGVELNLDTKVGDLSVGQRQLLEVVKGLQHKPKLLLLDEPTAVLPPAEIDAFLRIVRRIAESGCGIVLVTHKLAEVASVADHVTVFRGGRIVAESNSPAADMRSLVRAMVGRDVQIGTRVVSGADFSHVVLNVDKLTAANLDRIDLTVHAGEIVGIAGVEGNGQTELAEVLCGLRAAESGRVVLGGAVLGNGTPRAFTAAGGASVAEDRHAAGCILDMSLAENLYLGDLARFAPGGLLDRKTLAAAASEQLARFDVRSSGPDASFRTLSGGNQQKAVLARELSRPGHRFLLAAHPTRGLDIGAIEAVHVHLREAAARGVAILLISSELDELMALSDRILVMYRGRIVGEMAAGAYGRERIGLLMSGASA